MKTLVCISLAALTFSTTTVFAQQEATVERTPTAAQAARAAQRQLEAQRRAQEALLGKKPVVYGGFLRELRSAEKKSKLFSLRQPRDLKNDYKNVYLDERTARPKGFVFFSVGF